MSSQCRLGVRESQVWQVLIVLNRNPSLSRQIEATVSLQQLFFNIKMTSVPSSKDCMMPSSERNSFQTLLGLSGLFARWFECNFFSRNWFSNGEVIFLSPKVFSKFLLKYYT